MNRVNHVSDRYAYLKERNRYLEETYRSYVAIFDMLASSDEFQTELNSGRSMENVLQATMVQLKRLLPFHAMGILENQEDNSFTLAFSRPSVCHNELLADVDSLIMDGTFAWALNRNQAIIVPSATGEFYHLLHVIATQARIRGMLVGRLSRSWKSVDTPSLNALTITMRTAAHAMESCSLYEMLREHLRKLEWTVKQRTKELEATTKKLKKSNERLMALSDTDSLTGIYNRRFLMKSLEREIKRAKENRECLSLIILDIDHFKRINDTYGHQNGDVAIKTVAEACQERMRFHDILARYGGEEFVIVLPGTTLTESLSIAERLRESLHGINFQPPMENLGVTASFGVATFPTNAVDGITSLIRQADKALYEAKHRGRDRVEVMEVDI
ncbi:MAG TPA: GGDEF domain-containing protein [Geobacteraceae bacterium]|nr:GGDEF domain-containing protein [Geobacteraceae bacterium]